VLVLLTASLKSKAQYGIQGGHILLLGLDSHIQATIGGFAIRREHLLQIGKAGGVKKLLIDV
jgi:hypothetical protein